MSELAEGHGLAAAAVELGVELAQLSARCLGERRQLQHPQRHWDPLYSSDGAVVSVDVDEGIEDAPQGVCFVARAHSDEV